MSDSSYPILDPYSWQHSALLVIPNAFNTGDSLLFAAGAFAALGHLSVTALLVTFITSAVLGDALNYQLGKAFGAPLRSWHI